MLTIHINFGRVVSFFLLLTSLISCSGDNITNGHFKITPITSNYAGTLHDLYFVNSYVGFIVGDFDYIKNESILLRTYDGGNSWTLDSVKIKNLRINSIGGYGNRIFIAATDLTYPSPAVTSLLYYSDNLGKSWVHLADFNSIPVFITPEIGVLASGVSIYKTGDSGKTWRKVLTTQYGAPGQILKAKASKLYFFGGGAYDNADFGFLFSSSDWGETWEENANALNYITAMEFLTDNSGLLFTFDRQLYSTKNGGSTFELINADIQSGYPGIFFVNNLYGFYESETAIYSTTDGGKTWDPSWSDPSALLNGKIYINNDIGFCIGYYGMIVKISST